MMLIHLSRLPKHQSFSTGVTLKGPVFYPFSDLTGFLQPSDFNISTLSTDVFIATFNI